MPPVDALQNCQTKVLCNVAMSSSPLDYDEDWVVGIKFFGRQLNLCRPYRDLTAAWTAISIPSRIFQNSNLMYSKRDKKFYLPAPGSNYLCSWDLNFKQDDDNNPKIHKYLYANQPKLSQSEYDRLDLCSKAEHWVESASGERFLVKCYSFVSPSPEKEPVFMVYREEETTQGGRYMCYTEDIGDVCIFLSEIDPFCLEASSCPGLKPNSIYVREPVFGVYDIPTRNIRHFEGPVEGPVNPDVEFEVDFPTYWLPPLSI